MSRHIPNNLVNTILNLNVIIKQVLTVNVFVVVSVKGLAAENFPDSELRKKKSVPSVGLALTI